MGTLSSITETTMTCNWQVPIIIHISVIDVLLRPDSGTSLSEAGYLTTIIPQ